MFISAWDVDAPSEVDNIYGYDTDSDSWLLLGSLAGNNNAWGYTTFDLYNNFPSLFDEIEEGLKVYIDIDSTHNYDNWAVTLAKSVITTDGSTPPPPPPQVPEPMTLLLLGLGLVGVAGARKAFKK